MWICVKGVGYGDMCKGRGIWGYVGLYTGMCCFVALLFRCGQIWEEGERKKEKKALHATFA